jgi:hypothetical protein
LNRLPKKKMVAQGRRIRRKDHFARGSLFCYYLKRKNINSPGH